MNTPVAATAPRTRFLRPDLPAQRQMDPAGPIGWDATPALAPLATVPTDHDFMALHTAYRRFDGLARCHELSRAWANDGPDLQGHLERLIDDGRVFAFHWHDSLWVPRFQLDRSTHGCDLATGQVLDELAGSHDGWELAAWFVEPNLWLDDQPPAACLASRLPQVLDTARADRFVRRG